jgi:hypothetical protein
MVGGGWGQARTRLGLSAIKAIAGNDAGAWRIVFIPDERHLYIEYARPGIASDSPLADDTGRHGESASRCGPKPGARTPGVATFLGALVIESDASLQSSHARVSSNTIRYV